VRAWQADLLAALAGGVIGFLLLSFLYGDPYWLAVAGAAITGVLIKRAVDQNHPPALRH
jgi:hypothetical protein